MTYLPNSIERCTPIVGFDPYAYIMDRPSNLKINKLQSPYDTDYFAVGPDKNTQTAEAGENKEKKGTAGKILKTILGATAIGLAIFGISKGIKALPSGGSSATGGILSKIGTHLQNAGKCALKGISTAAGFIGRQFTKLGNFIQSKITPPPTPPTP